MKAETLTQKIGLWAGLIIFALMIVAPAPQSMGQEAWHVAALVLLMAIWWMSQAVPLTVTALLPFLALPVMDIMSAKEVASKYYSPILFLILGGAFIALAIERTGLHRRVALFIVSKTGNSAISLLLAFMCATAFLSMIISNTSTTLIMIPIALAVLSAGGIAKFQTTGFAGALIMGIAFSASIGGLGTLVGSPTNIIAAELINQQLNMNIDFATWATYGLPVVIIGIPLCAMILARVQKLYDHPFDVATARSAIGRSGPWSSAEKKVVMIVMIVMTGWIFSGYLQAFLPEGALTDGSIAIAGALALFIIPDGESKPTDSTEGFGGRKSRPLLNWDEANKAPWAVIMMFGGGLALAAGITESGLADWLGSVLQQFSAIHPFILALIIVTLIIIITEFASNVATATGIIPVVAALVLATGADPWMLALPAAMAASWGFMLPSGTGPNALAWSTGHIALPKMLMAGLIIDIMGIPLIAGSAWLIASL